MFMKRLLKGSEGFTLVEMTVVIAIIAVLAALTLPAVTGVTSDTRSASKIGDQKEVQQALVRYTDANGGTLATDTNTLDSDFAVTLSAGGDGVYDIEVRVAGGSTSGATPTVDALCFGDDIEAAMLQCFGNVKSSLLVPDFLTNAAQHSNELMTFATNIVPSGETDLVGDGDGTTADVTIANCDLAGNTCNFYLTNNADMAGTEVWAINSNNAVFTFKGDTSYGQ